MSDVQQARHMAASQFADQTNRRWPVASQAQADAAAKGLSTSSDAASRLRLAELAYQGKFMLPIAFVVEVEQVRREKGEYSAYFNTTTPLDADRAADLATTPSGVAALKARGLLPNPTGMPGGFATFSGGHAEQNESDRLLALTESGRRALVARGYSPHQIKELQDDRRG